MDTLIEFLTKHAAAEPISFHMPGHKGGEIFRRFGYADFFERLADKDITEIAGADNLYIRDGVLGELSSQYAKLYDALYSYSLVGGSTAGIISAILASVPRGGKAIISRGSHRAVFAACELGGIEPVLAEPLGAGISGTSGAVGMGAAPERTAYAYGAGGCGVSAAVSAEEIERCVKEHSAAAAVVITSPDYLGNSSDVARISEIVHRAGMTLIADQAHGAHLKFFSEYRDVLKEKGVGLIFPLPAEEQGADICINSVHKTLASFTQTAVLNICTEKVPRAAIEKTFAMVQSSSPSYILLASLAINARLLAEHGKKLICEWAENLEFFYKEAADFVQLRLCDTICDPTKLLVSAAPFEMSGAQLEEKLNENGIFPELSTEDMVLCMTGIGNTREHYEKLLAVLKSLR